MKIKVPTWVSILIVAVIFASVGVAFWWYTGGQIDYESRQPPSAYIKSLMKSEPSKGITLPQLPPHSTNPAPPTKLEFSAQTVIMEETDGKRSTYQGRIYYERGIKYRHEEKDSRGSRTTIVRFDKGVMWDVNNVDRTYTDFTQDVKRTGAGDDFVIDGAVLCKEPGWKHVGTESIGGELCDKYTNPNVLGIARTFWISRKIPGLFLKHANQDGSYSVELKNVRLGRQPDSLFEVPKGYEYVGEPMPQSAPQRTGKHK